jgi:hypothetical protein
MNVRGEVSRPMERDSSRAQMSMAIRASAGSISGKTRVEKPTFRVFGIPSSCPAAVKDDEKNHQQQAEQESPDQGLRIQGESRMFFASFFRHDIEEAHCFLFVILYFNRLFSLMKSSNGARYSGLKGISLVT